MFHVKHYKLLEELNYTLIIPIVNVSYKESVLGTNNNVSRETFINICKALYRYELCEAVIHNNSTIVDNSGILVENLLTAKHM